MKVNIKEYKSEWIVIKMIKFSWGEMTQLGNHLPSNHEHLFAFRIHIKKVGCGGACFC